MKYILNYKILFIMTYLNLLVFIKFIDIYLNSLDFVEPYSNLLDHIIVDLSFIAFL